jgi:hypothetical protein
MRRLKNLAEGAAYMFFSAVVIFIGSCCAVRELVRVKATYLTDSVQARRNFVSVRFTITRV